MMLIFFANYVPDDYLDCFGDLGTLNRTYHIELKDNLPVTVVPPSKVPFALRDKLKNEFFVTRELGLFVNGPLAFTSYFSRSSLKRFSSDLVILRFFFSSRNVIRPF